MTRTSVSSSSAWSTHATVPSPPHTRTLRSGTLPTYSFNAGAGDAPGAVRSTHASAFRSDRALNDSRSASPRRPPLLPLTKMSSGGHFPVWPMSDGTTLDVVGMSAAAASPSSLDDEDVGASREIALGPKDPPRVPRREEDWEGESSRAAWEVTLVARGARRHAGRERRDGTTRCAAETAAVSALMVRTRVGCLRRGGTGDSRGKSVRADCVKSAQIFFHDRTGRSQLIS